MTHEASYGVNDDVNDDVKYDFLKDDDAKVSGLELLNRSFVLKINCLSKFNYSKRLSRFFSKIFFQGHFSALSFKHWTCYH